MPTKIILILVNSSQVTSDWTYQARLNQEKVSQDDSTLHKTTQDTTRQDKTRWNIHRFVAHNDNGNDYHNHYSMNSDGMKIIS